MKNDKVFSVAPKWAETIAESKPRFEINMSEKEINKDLKKRQFDIIQETNPAMNDINTWIRDASDIKTYEEAIKEAWENLWLAPDFTKDMVKKALDEWEITVYSSKPIENWNWVTPSKMEAEAYAWWGKVYTKKVSLDDVAWVDELQWQLAELPKRAEIKIPQNWIDKGVKEIWESNFGRIYEWVKWADAEKFLIEQWQWEVKWAYTYKDKPVDLVRWEYDPITENGYWLSKISQKHPEVLWKIDGLIKTLPEKSKTTNRIKLDDGKYHITISRDYLWSKKNWVLTAFEITK